MFLYIKYANRNSTMKPADAVCNNKLLMLTMLRHASDLGLCYSIKLQLRLFSKTKRKKNTAK